MKTSRRYAPEVRERAVRLVLEHEQEYESPLAWLMSLRPRFPPAGLLPRIREDAGPNKAGDRRGGLFERTRGPHSPVASTPLRVRNRSLAALATRSYRQSMKLHTVVLPLLLAGGVADVRPADGPPKSASCAVDSPPPTYYSIDLVTTKNVPGTGYTSGKADVTFAPAPFGVSIAADGSYEYDVHVSFADLKAPPRGRYVAWVTTSQVDEIERLGALDDSNRVSGSVSWNKFLIVITLEESDGPDAEMWSGPIAFRGMSRSGKMHTMIGHGPLQEEKCAAYGYAN